MKKHPFSVSVQTSSSETIGADCAQTRSGHPRRKTRVAALLLAATIGLSGCLTSTDGRSSAEDNRTLGTIGGALIGAWIGYEFIGGGNGRYLAAIALGAAGAVGGSILADRLTQQDQMSMRETAYNTLNDGETGVSGTWANPNTGNSGTITPTRTFLDAQGRICRDYDAEVTLDGEVHHGAEAACKTEAGQWVLYSKTTG